MRRSAYALLTVIASILAGVGLASADLGGNAVDEPPAADSAPASSPVVAATDADPGRDEVAGLVRYRNASGKDCFAAGTVRGGKVGAVSRAGDFTELPLEDGGSCRLPDAPISITLQPQASGGTLVAGIADADTAVVEILATDRQLRIVPEADGAFASSTAEVFTGPLRIRMVRSDGTANVLDLGEPPPATSLEDMREQAQLYSRGHRHR